MLAKLNPDNRITLPESALSSCKNAEYFSVSEDSGRIILTPVPPTGADTARSALANRGITERDAARAVKWARRQGAGR